jgi:hypothetical protein
MLAARLHEYGTALVIDEVPAPPPGAGQVVTSREIPILPRLRVTLGHQKLTALKRAKPEVTFSTSWRWNLRELREILMVATPRSRSTTGSWTSRCQRAGNCAPAGTEFRPTNSPSTIHARLLRATSGTDRAKSGRVGCGDHRNGRREERT